MTDPIAELLTQIRNSSAINKQVCEVGYSKFKEDILNTFTKAGYISGFNKDQENKVLIIKLITGKIRRIARLSKPGRRLYVGYKQIPTVMRGYGTVIISTPNGVVTGQEAKQNKVGGELICELA